MCGIAGFIFDAEAEPLPRLDRMLDSMRARGPDGEGRFVENGVALGMRRLAIRDVANGNQPFSSDDGQIVAFVNGEIYNYDSLRRSLEGRGIRFRTRCDSEVLPHAFRVWGPEDFANRLDGMFGIAILDRKRRELHLYRDRYGEKPIFFDDSPGGFRFASQLSTLATEPEFDFEIDATALRQYLALHYVPGRRTMVQGIRRLLPGHRLHVDLDGVRPISHSRWAEPVARPPVPRSYGAATREVRQLLSESVASRMVSDVPLGVFLSGGLDSSAIAAIAKQHTSEVETFSVGFQDAKLDESAHARSVAAALGTRHHEFVFDLEACLSVFDDTIAALDEPVGDPACLPVFLLAREASQHVKVVLTGEGADEIFGGYAYHPVGNRRSSWIDRFRRPFSFPSPAVDSDRPLRFFQDDNTTPSGFPMLTSRSERDVLVPDEVLGSLADEDDWTRHVVEEVAGIGCPLRRAQIVDMVSWLPDDLLTKLDRMSMASSLEGRAPYLEPRLAELALAFPAQWKSTPGRRKRILRDAVAPSLPSEIVDRGKQGFVLPMQEWLVGPLRERLLDRLSGDSDDALDLSAARRIVLADLDYGASRSRLVYGLLAYREWVVNVREVRAKAAPPGVRDVGRGPSRDVTRAGNEERSESA